MLKTLLKDTQVVAKTNLNIGKVYLERGWNQLACKHYETVLQDYEHTFSSPILGSLYHNLGLAFKNLGRFQESLEAYKKALSLYSHDDLHNLANTWLNMGGLYAKLDNVTLAIHA